jgi:hypothetical protein
LIILMLLSAACNGVPAEPDAQATQTPAPTEIASPVPSPEPTPTIAAPLAILLAPPEADPDLVQALQSVLAETASQDGLDLQLRSSLSATELENVRLVVTLPPYPGLAEMAAAAPATQFLAVGIPGLQAGGNLSVLGGGAGRPDQTGFLAGFIAASISEDWRIAVLSEAGSVTGKALANAFANGEAYFCGLCLPAFPPYPPNGYPLSFRLPNNPTPADWEAALAELRSWAVMTVFVDPAIANPALLDALVEAGLQLILAAPPPDSVQESWVATLGAGDPLQPLREILPGLIAGQGGQEIDLPLGISQSNPQRLSLGRQRLAEDMLAELLAGAIDPGVDPSTGELTLP